GRVGGLGSRSVLGRAGEGGRVCVAGPAEEVAGLLEPYGGRVAIGALNGPSSTVVSGDADGLEELRAGRERARRSDGDYGSHSAHVEAISADILTARDGITPRPAKVPFH
ncbi:hypothetical protein VM98_37015, partial [Streptomyces rubellomurinus subsp. indigoferus]